MNRSPSVTVVGRGFVLEPSVVDHWSNVEFIMRTTIEKLKTDAFASSHQPPFYPSSYGYRQTFPTRKRAKEAIKLSVPAFHHMLAYCSYMIASTSALHFSQDRHRSLYENPSKSAPILEKIVSSDNQDSSHILLKLLWSTLGEIHKTQNFSGVVVTCSQPYDCQSVQDMHHYGVPVFIRWSNHLRFQTYSSFPGNEILMQWRPSVDSFAVLDQPQQPASSHSITPPVQHPPPPTPVISLDECADEYPWQYVEGRKTAIASAPNRPQSWLDRENSAKSFREPGKSGALVYQFSLVKGVEESTGEQTQGWARVVLTRVEALLLWSDVDPRNLW